MGGKLDSGPAFPCTNEQLGSGLASQGMSLRDWFAGQVMAAQVNGMIAARISTSHEDAALMAEGAYRAADALLAERSKP